MFGQLSNRERLGDVVLATQAHASKAYHLAFGKLAAKSTLADANTKRDYRIFEEFAYHTVGVAQKMRIENIFILGGRVYAFDSTTIDLCLSVYEWAHFLRAKEGIKVHTLFDLEAQVPTIFHITKAKLHDVNGMDAIPYEPGSFYVFDRAYNDFRRLHHIKEVGAFFVVRAKNPLKYQHVRWKIELFFKWMKQHLNIQRFWGETENAVRIQIYAAITAYCMVAIIQHETKTELSIYEVLETVSMVLTDKMPLYDLLRNSNDNIDNELDESSGPTLFLLLNFI